MLRSVALGVPILTLVSTSALAQPSLAPPFAQPPPAQLPSASLVTEEPEVIVTSYRDQILIASAIGVGSFIGGGLAEEPGGGDTPASNALFAIGGISMMFAPPIIHFAHGEIGRGLGSLGIRYALGSVGAWVAMSMYECDEEHDWFCKLDALGPGMLVGVSVASLIDAFAMTEQRTYRTRGRVLAPVVSATSDGGRIGLAGTF